jgi:hypothetical protein
MKFRVRSFREIDGNRSLHTIFFRGILGTRPADIKEAADISGAHGLDISDFAHKMFLVVQGKIDYGYAEAPQCPNSLWRHELSGKIGKDDIGRILFDPLFYLFHEASVHFWPYSFMPVFFRVIELLDPIIVADLTEFFERWLQGFIFPGIMVIYGDNFKGSPILGTNMGKPFSHLLPDGLFVGNGETM